MTILQCRSKRKLIFLHYKWSNWFNCNLQRSTWHQIKCYYSGKFWNKHALSQNWHILFLSQCKVFNICPGSTRTNINFDIKPPFTKDSNSTPISILFPGASSSRRRMKRTRRATVTPTPLMLLPRRTSPPSRPRGTRPPPSSSRAATTAPSPATSASAGSPTGDREAIQ